MLCIIIYKNCFILLEMYSGALASLIFTGIPIVTMTSPHNPKLQAVVERSNHNLKEMFNKQIKKAETSQRQIT